MLFGADAQVIQVEWQALAAFGSLLGGALVAGEFACDLEAVRRFVGGADVI